MKTMLTQSLAAGALLTGVLSPISSAHAHITLEYQVAPAASSYKASFKVGHGCAGSPTRQIVVEIPPGVQGARPMPKAGWALEVQREKLAQPIASHGRSITEDVVRISWTAKTRDDMLAHAHYDEFVLVAQMPGLAGPLYWPVRQVCEEGRIDWVEIPKPGQKFSDLKAPAASLEILPAGGGAGHNH
ncbi:MAG TPA: YcnI family protein [Burkholderiaceae bacterium]|nr:YcnI family protein [Burkholderiaceae bacterium]